MAEHDWDEYKKLILSELQDSKDFRKEVRIILSDLRNDVSNLKVKAAIVGGTAGLVGTGIVTAIISAFKFK